MKTRFTFKSKRFSSTAGEADHTHPDYINDGRYAKQLADFLEKHLAQENVTVSRNITEDWGRWLEIDHSGKFTLAIGCGDYGDRHLVFVVPDKPVIRRFLKKIPVKSDVDSLVRKLNKIFSNSEDIHDLTLTEDPN